MRPFKSNLVDVLALYDQQVAANPESLFFVCSTITDDGDVRTADQDIHRMTLLKRNPVIWYDNDRFHALWTDCVFNTTTHKIVLDPPVGLGPIKTLKWHHKLKEITRIALAHGGDTYHTLRLRQREDSAAESLRLQCVELTERESRNAAKREPITRLEAAQTPGMFRRHVFGDRSLPTMRSPFASMSDSDPDASDLSISAVPASGDHLGEYRAVSKNSGLYVGRPDSENTALTSNASWARLPNPHIQDTSMNVPTDITNIFEYCADLKHAGKSMFISGMVTSYGEIVWTPRQVDFTDLTDRNLLVWSERGTPTLLWMDCILRVHEGTERFERLIVGPGEKKPTKSWVKTIKQYKRTVHSSGGGVYSHSYPPSNPMPEATVPTLTVPPTENHLEEFIMSIAQPNTAMSDRISVIVGFESDSVRFDQSRTDTTLPTGLAMQAVVNGYLNVTVIVRTNDIDLQFTDGMSLMKSSVGSVVKQLVRAKLETVFDGAFVVGYHPHLLKPHTQMPSEPIYGHGPINR